MEIQSDANPSNGNRVRCTPEYLKAQSDRTRINKNRPYRPLSKTHCVNGHEKEGNRTKNHQCRPCLKDYQSKDRAIKGHWGKHGIKNDDGKRFTRNDFNRAFQIQGGRCAICSRHQTEILRVLCVDHDHATGKFRGLLCHECNTSLGLLKEDAQRLQSMICYLEKKP